MHYKHKRMQSFIRQLNMYSFRKIRRARLMTFRNVNFSLDRPVQAIARKPVKSLPKRRSHDDVVSISLDPEPNPDPPLNSAKQPPRSPSLIHFDSGEIRGLPSFCSIFMGDYNPYHH